MLGSFPVSGLRVRRGAPEPGDHGLLEEYYEV
jgi:hypothetical protein